MHLLFFWVMWNLLLRCCQKLWKGEGQGDRKRDTERLKTERDTDREGHIETEGVLWYWALITL